MAQDNYIHEPRCITPSNDDNKSSDILPMTKSHNTNNSKPMQVDEEEVLGDSHVIFPELNKSHLTCHDLVYSSQILDLTLETPSKEKFLDNIENNLPSPSLAFETTISLVDPRDKIFNDDPFSTFYNQDDESEDGELEINDGNYDYDQNEVTSLVREDRTVDSDIQSVNKDSIEVIISSCALCLKRNGLKSLKITVC